jgi:hypothetical protein
MRSYTIRTDLTRCDADGFALPLGVEASTLPCPSQGYTLEYTPSEDELAEDAYSFHVVVSHQLVRAVLHAAFSLLPDEVFPVIEVGSRDAYRSIDVFATPEMVNKRDFLEIWAAYEPFLLEDATIGAGASGDDPPIEVFLDAWKGVSIHVPVSQRDKIETMLIGLGLREVPETWPIDIERSVMSDSRVRDVLQIVDEHSPDLDELLLQMRESWGLSIWSTAISLAQVEELISETLAGMPEWDFQSIYSTDRVAFDERPEELSDLPPRRATVAVHQVGLDVWGVDGEKPPPDPFGSVDPPANEDE